MTKSFQRIAASELAFIILLSTIGLAAPVDAAVTRDDWVAGNIIDDGVFVDDNAMSASQIQSWLDSRLRNCDSNGTKPSEIAGGIDYDGNGTITRAEYGRSVGNPAPFTCLNKYYEVPKTEPGPNLPASNYGGAAVPAGAKSAAQLIYDAARRYNISPKVLLVKLGTESAGPLTDDPWPFKRQYVYAMGAVCPDSGPGGSANCDENYAGFSIQMMEAARLLRSYLDNMTQSWWPYKKPYQNNNVLWQNAAGSFNNPSGLSTRYDSNNDGQVNSSDAMGCGYNVVYIQNKATAALYTYTPYQPNAAALDSMYSTGDTCSAYGNRNFWRVYNDWFGKTRLPKVVYRLYDANTDRTGEIATVGFALEKKPRYPVTIPIAISSPSNAEILDSVDSITIEPENWDSPSKHIVTVVGKDNQNLSGTRSYSLITGSPSSSDSSFNQLTSSDTPDIPLVAQTAEPTAVSRLYSSTQERHFFTSDPIEKADYIANGWTDEGTRFYTCPAGSSTMAEYIRGVDSRLVPLGSSAEKDLLSNGFALVNPKFSLSWSGSVPVYRLNDPVKQRTLYSTKPNEGSAAGYENKGLAFYSCESSVEPVYRLYKPGGSHFYTSSTQERDKALNELSYKYEQANYYICDQSTATREVHRLLRTDSGTRFYTISERERQKAIDLGYLYEGIAFRLCDNGTNEVFRLYNENTGKRLYTASPTERDQAVSSDGFRYEGVGYRAE